jgi:hypothetical protein
MHSLVRFGARRQDDLVEPVALRYNLATPASAPANTALAATIRTVAKQASSLGMEGGDIAGSVMTLSARVAANTADRRSRRIFADRVGLAAARSRKPFLLQSDRRDLGASHVAMKDVSVPIIGRGRR